MNKHNTWTNNRHRIVTDIFRPILGLVCRCKYNISTEMFSQSGKRPFLILMNHQTGFDQFFVAMSFRGAVYYVATEDIFSLGWLSDILRYLVAPIPIRKQTTDLQAVKNCIRIAREGGTICIAPEGHRTFHGKTVYIKPSIASLAKKLNLPIAIFRIEGGYGVQPRWSDVVRRGKMHGRVTRVIEPEEYATLSNTELAELITQELYVNEARITGLFHHRKNAEFLERVVYICPHCGLTTFESKDDLITCKTCGRRIRHLPTKELQGVGFEFPHRFVSDWYEWQNDYINRTDLLSMTDKPLYEESVRLFRVHACKRKERLSNASCVKLYGDRITVDDRTFPFETAGAVTVLGKNKINIYFGDEIFQLKGSKRFNALKYVNFFHRYKNMTAGDCNGKFLGL